MKKISLEKILVDASLIASKTMLDVKNSPDYYVSTKDSLEMNESDVLTLADIKTEEKLKSYFAKVLPDYNFIGEESGNHNTDISKIIVTDPIDCTLGFTKGLGNFGSIIGIYENGLCIAGAECNATNKIIYFATQKNGFKRFGPDDIAPINTIYIEEPKNFHTVFGPDEGSKLNQRISNAFKAEFPNLNFITHEPNVLNKCRVFSGKYLGMFHGTWSRHDLAAAPILAKTTNCYLSDHNGNSFEPVDFMDEFRKYSAKDNVVIYSQPTVIAQNKMVYDRMMKVLSNFKKELDVVKNPKY
jgi:fructose-1,6-bisphosphatase/inositol monophosphatase family enzyme